MYVIERSNLDGLFKALREKGYELIGPTVRDGAVVYDTLTSSSDLPVGLTDEQDGGNYRLKKRNDQALFGYAVGPHSWKKFLHPPKIRLWEARRTKEGFQIDRNHDAAALMAFIGVRSCEIHAITIQDKVFLEGVFIDPVYQLRRQNIFIVALNCGQAGGTCFCVSMKTGPKVTADFDLTLTEVLEKDQHFFLVEVGSDKGREVLKKMTHRPAEKSEIEKAETILRQTAAQMGRSMDTQNLKELLYANLEHPRWDEVAKRCLSCANCTMVCPTCFCTTVEDTTDLTGNHAERWRRWDSCFTMDFSYIHGGNIRSSAKSRYRQWLTHKLAGWLDQFGSFGCVGCGRCISWCPVGIDMTEEVRGIREGQLAQEETTA